MERKLKYERKRIFEKKKKFHRDMSKLSFRKKLEQLINLQRIAKELRKKGIVWKEDL